MDPFVIVTADEKEQIRKHYNVNETQIKEDVELIQTWKVKQPHLPQNLTDDFVEKLLLRNKFRVERTKQKLDNYFSLRGTHRDLLGNFEIIVPTKQCAMYLPIPKLTPNLERVIIAKLRNPDPDQWNLIDNIKLNLAVEELTLQHDYAIGMRMFVDFSGFALKHLTKANPVPILKQFTLFEQAYSARILGLEIINAPSFASKILAMFKLVLRPKIFERIRFHEDLQSVYKIIPKECLPSEYGGTFSNLTKLLEKFDEAMKNHHDFFLENYGNVSQEHLRIEKNETSDEFGVDGTFKKLAID